MSDKIVDFKKNAADRFFDPQRVDPAFFAEGGPIGYFFAAQGLQGFFAAHGFWAAFAAQGFFAAHGFIFFFNTFFAAQGLQGLQAASCTPSYWPGLLAMACGRKLRTATPVKAATPKTATDFFSMVSTLQFQGCRK